MGLPKENSNRSLSTTHKTTKIFCRNKRMVDSGGNGDGGDDGGNGDGGDDGRLYSYDFHIAESIWIRKSIIHSLDSGKEILTLGHEHRVMSVVFVNANEPLCISGDNGSRIRVWSIGVVLGQEPLKKWYEQKYWRNNRIHALAVSGTEHLYTGSGDKSIKAWTLRVMAIDCLGNKTYGRRHIFNRVERVLACANCDRDAVVEMSQRLGFFTGMESELMLDTHVQAGFVVGLPFANTGGFDFRSTNITKSISNLRATMLKHRLTPPPDEVYSLHRKLSGAFLACIKLGAIVPCRELLLQVYDQYQFGDDDDDVPSRISIS
ncbi:hypothetical protein IFM89_012058 [Coptis chinensis]|uniref:Uncharacterized protein n=1 Tax=Coptis chinensis TaxID=261450 RepID=A0A835LVC9_9MAGN|nr:hypothetical protein IFM89_012058 [Coptis chinensis]